MTRKRWLLLGLLAFGAVGAVLIVLALLSPRSGVTKENFDRIEIGMTRAEVEAILGPTNGWMEFGWESDLGDEAHVFFDEHGRIETMDWNEWPDDRGVFEKLMDQLPWRERPIRRRKRL